MSENTPKLDFDDILIAWKAQLPGGEGNLYGSVTQKREQFGELLATFQENGIDELFVKTKLNIIIGHCVNPNSKKIKSWTEVTRKALELAFSDVYLANKVEIADAPEIEIKEIPKAVSDTNTENAELAVEVKPAIPLEESEVTPLEGIQYDPEMSKFLGFNDE